MPVSAAPELETPAESPQPAGRTGLRAGPALLAAVLVFGLLVGGAVGYLYPRLLSTPADDSVEAGFLRDMSTHHAQAVEMAMIAHADSTNPEIVTLAADIATTQQGQIGYMQAWLRDWNLSPTSSQPPMTWMPDSAGSVQNGLMPGMATPTQLDTLRKATGTPQDIQFLTLMRAHHLGGIHMAQEAITLSNNDNVDWIADTMVKAQQGEINLIDDYLSELQQK